MSIFNLVNANGQLWAKRNDVKIQPSLATGDRLYTQAPLSFGPDFRKNPLLPSGNQAPKFVFQASSNAFPQSAIPWRDPGDFPRILKTSFAKTTRPQIWLSNSVLNEANNVYSDGYPRHAPLGGNGASSQQIQVKRELEILQRNAKVALQAGRLDEVDRLSKEILQIQEEHFPEQAQISHLKDQIDELKALKGSSNLIQFNAGQHAAAAAKDRAAILKEISDLKASGIVGGSKAAALAIPLYTPSSTPLTASSAASTVVTLPSELDTVFSTSFPKFDPVDFKDPADYIEARIKAADRKAAADVYIDLLTSYQKNAKISATSLPAEIDYYKLGMVKAAFLQTGLKFDADLIKYTLRDIDQTLYDPAALNKNIKGYLISMGKIKIIPKPKTTRKTSR